MNQNGLNAGEPELLENLYKQYQTDPSQLDPSWVQYFKNLTLDRPVISTQKNLTELYRTYGYLYSQVNPIAMAEQQLPPELNAADPRLQELYCGSIGYEYKGIVPPEIETWIEEQIESPLPFTQEQKITILDYLNRSEGFESFLHKKYVGQKRFSLEGSETLIPMFAFLIETGADLGLEEIILGMAHRGRLNMLCNILNKPYHDVFAEFEEGYAPLEGTGDVKYHKGFSSETFTTKKGKKIKIVLAHNPSHLESVDPVVEGETRAKQMASAVSKIIPVLVHGDAALSGQGVVYETMQLRKLKGYETGGTIHFVINNQIGFTTIPRDLRSTPQPTDIARSFGIPIFHVNAEDSEACVRVAMMAMELRQKFHCDVMIDINCYRKYGHNESDEPAFTQPIEYQIIKNKNPIRNIYRDELINQKILDQQKAAQMEEEFKQILQKAQEKAAPKTTERQEPSVTQFGFFQTGVSKEILQTVTKKFSTIENGFQLHPKVANLVKERLLMVEENEPIDWGMGEFLAYATLLWEGIPIRISGQDCCRGTFSHRHAIWVDQKTENEYYPLAHLKEGQGRFEIYNSPLSEFAVLGFEYGYSVGCIPGLTIWEAQFGDFANGAQVIIDQYIVSGEQKWGQQSRLVLFLPHGYEGQGPEHSSARLERFLTLAGHDNIFVVNPTTPSQLFHLLRRQVLWPLIKPLIIFTPKGLLRYPACMSSLDDFTKGGFQEIIDDTLKDVSKLVFCSGRIYYDLLEARKENKTGIIRIEQLYPLNKEFLADLIKKYKNIEEYMWVQEEHENMGAWTYMAPLLQQLLPQNKIIKYVGRSRSASPATGSHHIHEQEHNLILNRVFGHET